MTQKIVLTASLILSFLFIQAQKITTIKGYAPDYIGKSIEVYEFMDLLSMKESLLAVSTVKEDSTFSMSFINQKVQKVVIRSNNNYSYLYLEPGKTYELLLPLHDKDKPYRPLGNYVTSVFLNLDSNDINQKIIDFDNSIDKFYARNLVYYVKNKQKFLDLLKTYKDSVYASIKNDSSYYGAFVHYSFVDMDMSLYTNEKARQYIFDTYISKYPVLYDNDFYFTSIKKLYSKIFSQLDMEVNNRVYMAILKKSPALIMKALESEYTLRPVFASKDGKMVLTHSNERLRELIMIKGLSEVYHNSEYPKTNVIEILDSVSKFGKYQENRLIASNIILRLTEITPGNPAPNFALTTKKGDLLSLKSFENSYLYFHIFRPDYATSSQDIELLKQIYQRYSDIVRFVSVYPKNIKANKKNAQIIQSIPWDIIELDEEDNFFKTYKVNNFPYYILIDRTGTVVSAPALGPKPNGELMTIDKIFYDIRKMDEIIKEREKRNK
ncbi:MAG: hypothetical protein J0G96_05770 [Flavobacteriia bacterium]|nr:hypothetical protein [Flavobacteriia bacterium]OJX39341.1 MAG: hypothetical protein BGO87_05030 [Flavobacteriia bacterium 40-80]